MGFALWIHGEVAWAQGLHEYRPMGAAVIALTDCFRVRDFRPGRDCPARGHRTYAGLFASLEEVNAHLAQARRSRAMRKKLKARQTFTPAWV